MRTVDAMGRVRRRRGATVLLAATLCTLVSLSACSETSEVATSRATSSTVRIAPDDAIGNGDDAVTNGSEANRQLQLAIDKLASSNDVCAILTQRDVKGLELDPTTMASAQARKILSQGVLKVYDHLVAIGDATIKDALRVQRDTYVSVLDIVDRYAIAASSKQSNEEIRAVTSAPQFLAAQQQTATWAATHCN